MRKNTLCLWYESGAENAANFCASVFPDSSVGSVHRAPGDNPSGKQGDVLTVEFTVLGVACVGLNVGMQFEREYADEFGLCHVYVMRLQ